MKTIFILLISALTCSAQVAITGSASVAGLNAFSALAGTGVGGAFSDDFTRADSGTLGANWTSINTVILTNNTAYSPTTLDLTTRGAAYTGGALSTVNQYVKITLNSSGANMRPGVVLRYTDASSPCYYVVMDEVNDSLNWYYAATPTSTPVLIDFSAAVVFTLPGTVGITITGTGANTIVRCWINPTGNAPSSAVTWGGVGSDVPLTADPSAAVDTGFHVGIAGFGSASDLIWDDFFGGDTP